MRRLEGHRGKVLCVAYAPDGQTLASGSSGKIIKLWDVRAGKARATLRGFDYAAVCVAFHPDGRTLASGHMGGWAPLGSSTCGTSPAARSGPPSGGTLAPRGSPPWPSLPTR